MITYFFGKERGFWHYTTFGDPMGYKFDLVFGRDTEGKEIYRSVNKQYTDVIEHTYNLSTPVENSMYLPAFDYEHMVSGKKMLSKASTIKRLASSKRR